MKINVMFPSKYLKAQDVLDVGGELVLTVSKVEMDTFETQNGGNETKPIVSFRGQDKQLILNKTNTNSIIAVLGEDDTDNWIDKEITLISQKVEFSGNVVDAIRVKLNQTQSASTSQTASASEFWKVAYGMKLTPEEGQAILGENGGDFAKAIEALMPSDELPL